MTCEKFLYSFLDAILNNIPLLILILIHISKWIHIALMEMISTHVCSQKELKEISYLSFLLATKTVRNLLQWNSQCREMTMPWGLSPFCSSPFHLFFYCSHVMSISLVSFKIRSRIFLLPLVYMLMMIYVKWNGEYCLAK